MKDQERIAIVLLNLGGPITRSKIKPFLFNLFNDENIIRVNMILRYFIAKIISIFRTKKVTKLYDMIGGGSPILFETQRQLIRLQVLLSKYEEKDNRNFKAFICMRYASPMSEYAVQEIKSYYPDKIVLLPLYPQYSTATTKSSFNDIIEEISFNDSLKDVPIYQRCCYPIDSKFINAHFSLIIDHLKKNKVIDKIKENPSKYVFLFSAHGLPKSFISRGDPYQYQIELSFNALVPKIKDFLSEDVECKITYQSKVGPMKWLTPNTEEEISKLGEEKKNIVIIPIAFVSEHIETLVELDIEYHEIAKKFDVEFHRIPTLSANDLFIESIADIVRNLLNEGNDICDNKIYTNKDYKICPKNFKECYLWKNGL